MNRILTAFVALLAMASPALAQQEEPAQPAPAQTTAPAIEAPPAAATATAADEEEADEEEEEAKPPVAHNPTLPPGHPAGFDLGHGVRLNGKFDLAYEYKGFNKLDEGHNELNNYHHFVFLSRQSQDDPFFFSGEIIERYFYEFGATHRPRTSDFSFTAKTGKILVPFGGEPLFHHNYGGLTGFDQPILPVVFSQFGAAGNVQYRGNGFRLANDLYAIQGYGLETTNAVINLQTDFSKNEKLKAGFGDRVGFGMGPFSIWYSGLLNDLGHKRLLFMQAVDAELFRPTDLPVLKNLVVQAGILRADVSGGAPNEDYYHFADYVFVRYYITDQISAEARTGLRTFNNRNGSYKDDRRFDEKDGSAHTLMLQYRNSGFLIAVQRFWLYEKANEVPNDMIRVRTGYEF